MAQVARLQYSAAGWALGCVQVAQWPHIPPKSGISREISQASASTVRAHFGYIFKATADCATGVWCVFYVRILDT